MDFTAPTRLVGQPLGEGWIIKDIELVNDQLRIEAADIIDVVFGAPTLLATGLIKVSGADGGRGIASGDLTSFYLNCV